MVDEEETEFHEEYVNEEDPSILRFLLAAGDEVSSKQLRDDLMTMLIAGHETSAAVLTWTTYLLSQVTTALSLLLSLFVGPADPLKGNRNWRSTLWVRGSSPTCAPFEVGLRTFRSFGLCKQPE
jgi:hypothetical protein